MTLINFLSLKLLTRWITIHSLIQDRILIQLHDSDKFLIPKTFKSMDNNTFLDTRQNLHTTSASDQFLIPKTFKSMDNNTFLDTRQNLHTTSCLIQLYLWRNSVLGQMEKLSIKCFFLT